MRPQNIVITLVVVVVIIAVLLAARNHTNSSTTSTTSPTPSVAASSSSSPSASTAINISGFAFAPAAQTAHIGDTVTWTNQDSVSHTVTSTDGGPLSSGTIAPGGTYSFTFTKAGTYTYHCAIHSSMVGSITVQ